MSQIATPFVRDADDPVLRQYQSYPYPSRDPADEKDRLLQGTPSRPIEIDHYFYQGQRDWTQPMKFLVAGGGTGDAAIMLGQKLKDLGCPGEVTYLDMSKPSREIAEARAEVRGLDNIRFVTSDLSSAVDLGPFDYIDCCGVLHHLPDPDQGFAALSAALVPDGGIGIMVYAPYGRIGVYPMQAALRALVGSDSPSEQVRLARELLSNMPETNWLAKNKFVLDYRHGDAGLYDMLLHSRDQAYEVGDLRAALDRAGLKVVTMIEPLRYDPTSYLSGELAARAAAMPLGEREALAERLAGNFSRHTVYAVPKGRKGPLTAKTSRKAVPHVMGISGPTLGAHLAEHGVLGFVSETLALRRALPKHMAPALALVDGQRSLWEIAKLTNMHWAEFKPGWDKLFDFMNGMNVMHYSAAGPVITSSGKI